MNDSAEYVIRILEGDEGTRPASPSAAAPPPPQQPPYLPGLPRTEPTRPAASVRSASELAAAAAATVEVRRLETQVGDLHGRINTLRDEQRRLRQELAETSAERMGIRAARGYVAKQVRLEDIPEKLDALFGKLEPLSKRLEEARLTAERGSHPDTGKTHPAATEHSGLQSLSQQQEIASMPAAIDRMADAVRHVAVNIGDGNKILGEIKQSLSSRGTEGGVTLGAIQELMNQAAEGATATAEFKAHSASSKRGWAKRRAAEIEEIRADEFNTGYEEGVADTKAAARKPRQPKAAAVSSAVASTQEVTLAASEKPLPVTVQNWPPAIGTSPSNAPPRTPMWPGAATLASGGKVRGEGHGDIVPAMLTPGERVVTPTTAAKPEVKKVLDQAEGEDASGAEWFEDFPPESAADARSDFKQKPPEEMLRWFKESANQGLGKLSDDEAEALSAYKSKFYEHINTWHRYREPHPYRSINEDVEYHSRHLDQVMSRSKTGSDVAARRAVLDPRIAAELAGLKVGDLYVDPAFASTTLDRSVSDYQSPSGTVLNMHVPAGTKSFGFGDVGRESELMLARGAGMRLQGIRTEGENTVYDMIVEGTGYEKKPAKFSKGGIVGDLYAGEFEDRQIVEGRVSWAEGGTSPEPHRTAEHVAALKAIAAFLPEGGVPQSSPLEGPVPGETAAAMDLRRARNERWVRLAQADASQRGTALPQWAKEWFARRGDARAVRGFAEGGSVPGDTDTVPAMLTPGERVVTKRAAADPEVKEVLDRKEGVQHFAVGGTVKEASETGKEAQLARAVAAELVAQASAAAGGPAAAAQQAERDAADALSYAATAAEEAAKAFKAAMDEAKLAAEIAKGGALTPAEEAAAKGAAKAAVEDAMAGESPDISRMKRGMPGAREARAKRLLIDPEATQEAAENAMASEARGRAVHKARMKMDPAYRRKTYAGGVAKAASAAGMPGVAGIASAVGALGSLGAVAGPVGVAFSVLKAGIDLAEKGVKSFGEAAASIAAGDAMGLARSMTGLAGQIPLVGGLIQGVLDAGLNAMQGMEVQARRLAQVSAPIAIAVAQFDVQKILRDIDTAPQRADSLIRGMQARNRFEERMNEIMTQNLGGVIDFMETMVDKIPALVDLMMAFFSINWFGAIDFGLSNAAAERRRTRIAAEQIAANTAPAQQYTFEDVMAGIGLQTGPVPTIPRPNQDRGGAPMFPGL